MKVFAGDLTDGITEGFKMTAPYGDVTDSPRDSNRNLRIVTCLFTVRMADGLRQNNSVGEAVDKS